MASQTQICNLALAAIGTRSSIASINERSKEANALLVQYQTALEAVLQAAFWNFARKQVALTLLRDATATPSQNVPAPWLYEYSVPSDCLQARYIMPQLINEPGSAAGAQSLPPYVGPPVRWVFSSDVDAAGQDVNVILSNQPQALLVYTKRLANTELFDAQFTRAFAAYLGHSVCLQLTGDKTMWKASFEMADSITKQARASNGNEGLTVIDTMPDWIRVRGYVADWSYPDGGFFTYGPNNLVMIS